MNLTPFIWLIKDDSIWNHIKTNLLNEGFNLINRPAANAYPSMRGIVLFTDHELSPSAAQTSNLYKILLLNSKESLYEFSNLLNFDEIIFKTDLDSVFLKTFSGRLLTKSNAKFQKTESKHLQIHKLKAADQDLLHFNQQLKNIQEEASQTTQALNIELQKSHALLKFILLLSKEVEISRILDQIWKSLLHIHGTLNIFLIQAIENDQYRFYLKQKGMFLYKAIALKNFSEEASFNDKEWPKTIAQVQNQKTESFFSFPLHKYFKNRQSSKQTVLLIEHKYLSDQMSTTVKFISERLPFISMAIEKSRISDELITKNSLWENTFDGITDPLIIVDHNYSVVRSNQTFTNSGTEKICYLNFTSTKKPCKSCPLTKKNPDLSNNFNSSSELHIDNKIYLVKSYPLSKAYANKYFVNHYSEISKERELLVKTLHIEKMRSLDYFADQLSTNLKSPLETIKKVLQDNPQLSNCSDTTEIKNAVLRSQLVLTNLTEFAKGNPNLCTVELDSLIEATLPFFKSLARKHKISLNLNVADCQAKVSPSLFQQVIFNLVNNSCQAMTQAGNVTISSKITYLDDIKGIRIEIDDNGPGIPEHLRENIFKSAFTTKDIKKGTGLGLKICQFIIKSFSGTIEYQPLVSGSRFWIWIPVIKSSSI